MLQSTLLMRELTFRRLMRWSIVLAAAVMHNVVSGQSNYYDKYVYLRSLPSPPMSPRSQSECDTYAERVNQHVLEVAQAHDTCLRVEKASIARVIADVHDRCSNPTCQDLHTARQTVQKEAESKKSACLALLDKNPQKCAPPDSRSCANNCGGEWGMSCPFTTVCDPIKHRCEKAKL
jgi:hypothetical protein